MAGLMKANRDVPAPIPDQVPGQFPEGTLLPSEVQVAMEALQRALDAGVTMAKNHEDAKTERALIVAKKEIQIAAIESDTQRGIASDRNLHERRMAIIQSIGSLITNNAQVLTPDIMSAAQFLLQVLREEK